jgi:hypothetical protein
MKKSVPPRTPDLTAGCGPLERGGGALCAPHGATTYVPPLGPGEAVENLALEQALARILLRGT